MYDNRFRKMEIERVETMIQSCRRKVAFTILGDQPLYGWIVGSRGTARRLEKHKFQISIIKFNEPIDQFDISNTTADRSSRSTTTFQILSLPIPSGTSTMLVGDSSVISNIN